MDKSTYQVLFWQVIAQVPTGKVVTYGQVAQLAGLPGMARAVGRTLSQLPEDTKLPWFRVLNAQGKISFPVDSNGWKRQKALLEQEGIVFINGRIKLSHYQWQP
jgi:methylated-DNA-protein-cysteine methyltransferase-like protein